MNGFRQGIPLSDGITKPAEIEFAGFSDVGKPIYRVTLTEGRYHQIKRMFASLGNSVTELKRVKMGALPLDESLAPGECRILTESEIKLIGG